MSPARPPAPRPRRTAAPSAPAAPKASSGKAPAKTPSSVRAPARAKPASTSKTTKAARSEVQDQPGVPSWGRPSTSVTTSPGAGPPSIAPRQRDRVVVEQAAQRFAERAQARRRVTRRKVATVVTVVLVVVALGWVGLFSPVLGLDTGRVGIVGAHTTADGASTDGASTDGASTDGACLDGTVAVADLRAVVARHAGEPLPRLDTAALRTELLAVHGVKDVRVVRRWPRGLTVTVTARVPVAAVPTGDQVALLDADGVTLRTEPTAPAGLAVVDAPADDRRALLAALRVVAALPADLAGQVATVAAPTQDTVTLTLADGVRVVWGSAEDNALKAQVVAALRGQALDGVTTIDVSAPTMPVVR